MTTPPDDDGRLDQLVELVVELASGNLSTRMSPSPEADAVDAVVVGLNMLAEELEALYAGLEARVAERTEQLEQAQRQLELLALFDPLTGLANRTLLGDRMDQAIVRAARSGCPPAVMVLDLDGFKAVNDSFGHAVGDIVLTEVARRLRKVARASDTVARLGGDEFALVVLDTDAAQVLNVADRILAALRTPIDAGEHSCLVGTSIGICFAVPGQSTGALLRNADIAMYSAKGDDENRVQVYRPTMHTEAMVRHRLTDELRSAAGDGELVLHYQPIVDIRAGVTVGVEALVRWQHPRRGLVPPEEFIAVAEQTGLITQIGDWVAHTALAQLAHWRDTVLDGANFRMHVNTSPVQLRSPGFAEHLLADIERYGVGASELWLEITESMMLADDTETARTLDELRAAGVGLVMDDFGTGYASIGYVRRLHLDTIKVDRSLVTGLDTDPQQRGVAAAIMSLVDALGLRAIAEGVETAAEHESLVALGYRYAQGYHYGRPVPADEATRRLAPRAGAGDSWNPGATTAFPRVLDRVTAHGHGGDLDAVDAGADHAARDQAGRSRTP